MKKSLDQKFEMKSRHGSAYGSGKSKKKIFPRKAESHSSSEISVGARPLLQVANAIAALRNNETRVTSECKGINGKVTMESKVSYPAELVAAFRGLFPASKEYLFQLHQVLTISSSAGGGTLGFVAISPSVASYGEWSALAALFDEVKGVSTSIDLVTNQLTTNAIGVQAMVLALDEQNLSTDPASYLSVYRLSESKTFAASLGDNGSGRHVQSRRFTSRSWCNTATPYSTSPIGGLIGCWVYGNSGIFPASVSAFTASSWTAAMFRNRA
jgi:hypothetical protein